MVLIDLLLEGYQSDEGDEGEQEVDSDNDNGNESPISVRDNAKSDKEEDTDQQSSNVVRWVLLFALQLYMGSGKG